MSYLQELLSQKEAELTMLIEELKEVLTGAPEGRLRIAHGADTPQYFYRSEEVDGPYRTGQYIKKENIQLAYSLAQRDYDRKLLKIAEIQRKAVRKLVEEYQEEELVNVFTQMNVYRKKLVIPRVISDEMFAEQWEKVEYQGKYFNNMNAEIYTEKGERVRSKSEKIIADMLYRNGLHYRYEYPIMLQGIGTVYPDFTILNLKTRQEVYWEHLGMMDIPEYCERALYKLSCYIKNDISLGDRLLISYETSKRPLETAVIEKIMKANF